jgi:hypothetical protein
VKSGDHFVFTMLHFLSAYECLSGLVRNIQEISSKETKGYFAGLGVKSDIYAR